MTWQVAIERTTYEHALKDTESAAQQMLKQLPDDAPLQEIKEQVQAVTRALSVLLTGFTSWDSDIRIDINGHVNKQHEPIDGWSNDSLNIRLYQISTSV